MMLRIITLVSISLCVNAALMEEPGTIQKRAMYFLSYNPSKQEIKIDFRICTTEDRGPPCPGFEGHEVWIYKKKTRELIGSKYEAKYAEIGPKGWYEAPYVTLKLKENAIKNGVDYIVVACVRTTKGSYEQCNVHGFVGGESSGAVFYFLDPSSPDFPGWAIPESVAKNIDMLKSLDNIWKTN